MALATNALTMITTVEDELNISTGTQDALLTRYINSASTTIETFCNRKFYYEVDIEEYIKGYGDPRLKVNRPPLTAIDSITYDGSTVDSSSYEIEGSGDTGFIRHETSTWLWTLNTSTYIVPSPIVGTERPNYLVTYTGGYITPQQDNDDGALTRNLPYDLEDACIQLVSYRYRAKGRDPTIKSEKLLSASITYQDVGTTALPDSVQDLLTPYRESL